MCVIILKSNLHWRIKQIKSRFEVFLSSNLMYWGKHATILINLTKQTAMWTYKPRSVVNFYVKVSLFLMTLCGLVMSKRRKEKKKISFANNTTTNIYLQVDRTVNSVPSQTATSCFILHSWLCHMVGLKGNCISFTCQN